MSVRVRFAPSPTGQVHIGNIRAAIFNWLYARHEGGKFLLRIEDTDLERSTPEAIETLLQVMDWLKLDYDEKPPLYQTTQSQKHLDAAAKLLAQNDAYKDNKGGGGEAILFRIPWDSARVPGIADAGTVETPVHPEVPVVISHKGVDYAGISSKGKPAPGGACLAGFHDLKVLDANGNVIFVLADNFDAVMNGQVFELPGAAKLSFTRRTITYHDIVKGEMTKPLDSMKDVVIVRSDGSPVFHLANVVDDITQGITHIIRGDDHVENTFRHIMLFACLGEKPPCYGHLPMIVNAAGKPYSKRDGDAFVGDFKTKGFLSDALVNYLSLLGWSPGDDREKMTRQEMIEAFTLERAQRGAAQMDIQKLTNLNGLYIAEMPEDEFKQIAKEWIASFEWGKDVKDDTLLDAVCRLMHSRVKVFADIDQWVYFFNDIPEYDEKVCAKQFKDEAAVAAIKALPAKFAALATFDAASIEGAVAAAAEEAGLAHGKLNQPLRAAVTGAGIGAGIYETVEILGREKTLKRLDYTINNKLTINN